MDLEGGWSTRLSTRQKIEELEARRRGGRMFYFALAFVVAVFLFLCFIFFVDLPSLKITRASSSPARSPTLKDAKPHTNCSDFSGAVKSVQDIAAGEGYLHVFEYNRLHPCCLIKRGESDTIPEAVTTDDIVFIIMASVATQTKARGVVNSWGKGLENLLLISDVADPQLGAISLDEASAPAGEARASMQDKQHRQIWAMKYILSSEQYKHLQSKKWYFMADDDTWVNIPALLDLTRQYDYRCPVTFGYVWSHVWMEEFDYISGGAGLLLSSSAFTTLTPAFYTDVCPFAHYNDITFGRCAWALQVQIVHHRGFYFDPPERSKDRHETVWFPPIAEAITYHYVHAEEMAIMTNYANERWQWVPPPRKAVKNSTSDANSPTNSDENVEFFSVPGEFVVRNKNL